MATVQLIGEVNNLPATVGGGGVHADGKLPRFREDDFLVESELGPVDGASIADWPVTYDDLEPLLRRGRAARRRRRARRGQPVRRLAVGPVPDAAGRPHVRVAA